MANAHVTLKAHIEATSWVFALGYLEEWRAKNPHASLDDYAEECRRQVAQAKDRLIDVEVENGSTREAAENMTRRMV